MQVKDYKELREALEANEKEIEIVKSFATSANIYLKDGVSLKGKDEKTFLSFIGGGGFILEGNNQIRDLGIQTSADKRAIYIDSSLEDLGKIGLKNLTVTGVVQLLTRQDNKSLEVEIENLDIVAADARSLPERPMKYGVNVYQGALSIYNFNPDEDSTIKVKAKGIRLGRKNAPVMGSGVFISGFNDNGGKVRVESLETEEIHSNGMIPQGQPNLITGAIFIVYGAFAKDIISHGPVTTYGTNDMVLDVWGEVDSWITKDVITSLGTSGIGFVNFGKVKKFVAEDTVRTFGIGARGFNQYDGTIEEAYFEEIKTVGNGSIGMQFSKPVGKISIGKEVSTFGSLGQTLVKGEIKELKADAISVLEGGEIKELNIEGDLITRGDEVISYHVNGGKVDKMTIKGHIIADGKDSKEVFIENGGSSDTACLEKYIK